jgi:hypothetical protein
MTRVLNKVIIITGGASGFCIEINQLASPTQPMI